jgi:chemotaxis methyl-accepting protein methylase
MSSLSEAINDLVERRLRRALETGEMINVPDLASEITDSLADLIVTSALPDEQPRLIDHVVTNSTGWLRRSDELVWAGVCSRSCAAVKPCCPTFV